MCFVKIFFFSLNHFSNLKEMYQITPALFATFFPFLLILVLLICLDSSWGQLENLSCLNSFTIIKIHMSIYNYMILIFKKNIFIWYLKLWIQQKGSAKESPGKLLDRQNAVNDQAFENRFWFWLEVHIDQIMSTQELEHDQVTESTILHTTDVLFNFESLRESLCKFSIMSYIH